MRLPPFAAEVTLAVEVEILEATLAEPGRYHDRPERCWPGEPESVELRVRLGNGLVAVDVTEALPAAVRSDLEADALERLHDAADLARLR